MTHSDDPYLDDEAVLFRTLWDRRCVQRAFKNGCGRYREK